MPCKMTYSVSSPWEKLWSIKFRETKQINEFQELYKDVTQVQLHLNDHQYLIEKQTIGKVSNAFWRKALTSWAKCGLYLQHIQAVLLSPLVASWNTATRAPGVYSFLHVRNETSPFCSALLDVVWLSTLCLSTPARAPMARHCCRPPLRYKQVSWHLCIFNKEGVHYLRYLHIPLPAPMAAFGLSSSSSSSSASCERCGPWSLRLNMSMSLVRKESLRPLWKSIMNSSLILLSSLPASVADLLGLVGAELALSLKLPVDTRSGKSRAPSFAEAPLWLPSE